jgi:dual specificity tyrosine-phosphorylation-regulated kinase 2/3/4
VLKLLNDNDKTDDHNVVRMHDFEVFRKHLVITFELLSINLYEFIKANNHQGVSLSLVRRFAI